MPPPANPFDRFTRDLRSAPWFQDVFLFSPWRCIFLAFLLAATAQAAPKNKGEKSAQPELKIPLAKPGNIFAPEEEVVFTIPLPAPAREAEVSARAVDYFGREIWRQQLPATKGGGPNATLALGKLDPGYYELSVNAGSAEKPLTGRCSFGVAPMIDRTAEEARRGGFRFGLKWGGAPKGFDELAAMTVAARLGLQWTRDLFTDAALGDLARLPVNLVYKVEGIPDEAYDEQRYGPKDDFRVRHFNWKKASVPLEAPYKKWLREQVALLPKENAIFEIWNEPWGKIPPADFARIAQWATEAIHEVRPDAKVGPNLGHLDYDADFIAAGGMKNMQALLLHTYGHPERSGLRADLRRIREFYREKTGRDIELYVTEFGSSSAPAGPNTSEHPEQDQANKAVRTALALYAEDVKAFMPHVLAQREASPTNKEDWRGYFRANGQPKPALLALATAARLIDGSRYAGDLFLKPDTGASLFKRGGRYTLALWSNDLAIPVEVEVGQREVILVDLMGKATTVPAKDGRLPLTLTGDPVFLVGVDPRLATVASRDLREDQWPTGKYVRANRVAHQMKTAPAIDGDVAKAEWAGQTSIDLSSEKIPRENASAKGYVAWDRDYFYVAVEVRDDHPNFNPNRPYSVYDADSLEIFLGSNVKFQIPEFIHDHDYHYLFSTTSADGQPVAGLIDTDAQVIRDVPGLKMASRIKEGGWSMEVAIPVRELKDFQPQPGHKAAFELRINDNDPDRPPGKNGRFKVNPADGGNPSHVDATVWSTLTLAE